MLRIFLIAAVASASVLCSAGRSLAQAAPAHADSVATVDESQLTRKPTMVNRSDVARLLGQSYPTELRDAGLMGTVYITFVITERGVPTEIAVANSSGYLEMDRAGMEVAKKMRFSHPELNGAPVRVRVRIPVTFQIAG
jgi:TonB family protein